MGIDIGFRGKLDDPARLDEVLEEIRGFCRRAGWEFDEHTEHLSGIVITTAEEASRDDDERTPDPDPEPWPEEPEGQKSSLRVRVSKRRPPTLIEETIRGVIVKPPGTEWLNFKFDTKGWIANYWDLPEDMVLNAVPGETHYLGWRTYCKTTSAVESHIGICLLLRTLAKYMSGLKVSDSTDFYETGKLSKLYQDHMVMGAMIGLLKRPGSLQMLFKAAGLPELAGDAKVVPLDSIHVAPKQEKPKKKNRVM